MFSVHIQQGRLIEGRVYSLADHAEATAYSVELTRCVQATTRSLVLCADHRRVAIYSQPVADELARLFGVMNKRLERVAVLVSRSNATLALQLERIVREAKNPNRRVFYDVEPAIDHLALALDNLELQRARTFLADPL